MCSHTHTIFVAEGNATFQVCHGWSLSVIFLNWKLDKDGSVNSALGSLLRPTIVKCSLRCAKDQAIMCFVCLNFTGHAGPDSWHELIPDSWIDLNWSELIESDFETGYRSEFDSELQNGNLAQCLNLNLNEPRLVMTVMSDIFQRQLPEISIFKLQLILSSFKFKRYVRFCTWKLTINSWSFI